METNTPSPTSLSAQAEALSQANKNPVVIPHKYRPVVGGLALLIVVFLSIAAGTLLFANYWPQWDDSSPALVSPTPSVGPTADWKTYADTQYGFEFRYPATALIVPTQANGLGQFKVGINYMGRQGLEPARLEISTSADNRLGTTGSGHLVIVPQKATTFDGGNSAGTAYEGENPIEFTLSNNYVYANCINYSKEISVIKFCNEILSTFKFSK